MFFRLLKTLEYGNIVESINISTESKGRKTYKGEGKMKTAKCANIYGDATAVRQYKSDFPKITESTVRGWLMKFRTEMKRKVPLEEIVLSNKRRIPLLLPEELEAKLRVFINNQRKAGGTINRHTLCGILMGLIKSNLARYGNLLEFVVIDGWLNYLYKRMNLVQRFVTTSRPTVTKELWLEVQTTFLYDICVVVQKYNIPNELIITVDQTPSKYVTTGNITMAEKNSKHVPKHGANDKHAITATFAVMLSIDILPFQLIYQGKTSCSLPSAKFPKGFLLSFNMLHWSKEMEMLRSLKEVIEPYLSKKKKELGLPDEKESLLIWKSWRPRA